MLIIKKKLTQYSCMCGIFGIPNYVYLQCLTYLSTFQGQIIIPRYMMPKINGVFTPGLLLNEISLMIELVL